MAMENGCEWVCIGASRNKMRYSLHRFEAGRLAEKVINLPEYKAFLEKFVELVDDEQSECHLWPLCRRPVLILGYGSSAL